VTVLGWYRKLDDQQQETWNCEYCRKRKLDKIRNCQNKYNKTTFILTDKKVVTQCPISLLSTQPSNVYSLIKQTLANSMGIVALPSVLVNELNVHFVYRDIIVRTENIFEDS